MVLPDTCYEQTPCTIPGIILSPFLLFQSCLSFPPQEVRSLLSLTLYIYILFFTHLAHSMCMCVCGGGVGIYSLAVFYADALPTYIKLRSGNMSLYLQCLSQ